MATFELTIEARDQASGVLDTIKEKGKSAGSAIQENWGKIAGAGIAAGAAMEGFARHQQDNNILIQQMAGATGESEKEIRKMAGSVSDATAPIGDMLELMDIGRRRGIDGAEAMADYAATWDFVGDASGESAIALAEAGTALERMGISAGQEAEAMDAFGFILDNTTQGVGDFLTFVDRMGGELQDLGMDIDDTAAILGIMEQNLGLSGRTARQEFRSGIAEAEAHVAELEDAAKETSDQIVELRGEFEELEAKSRDLNQEITLSTAELDVLRESATNSRDGIFELADQLENAGAEGAAYAATIRDLIEEHTQQRNAVRDTEGQLRALNAEVEESGEVTAEQARQIAELEQQLRDEQAALADTEQSLQGVSREISTNVEGAEELGGEIGNLINRYKDQTSEGDNVQRNLWELHSEYGNTQDAMAEVERQSENLEDSYQRQRQEIEGLDGSMAPLLEALGISQDEFDAMRAEVEGSSEAMDRTAQAVADNMTPLQELQERLSIAGVRFGGLASNAALAAPILMGLGPTIKGLSAAKYAWSAAQWAINAALSANPIGLVVIAIAALAGGVLLAYRRSETFRDIVDAAFSRVRQVAMFMWSFIRDNVIPVFTQQLPRAARFVRDQVMLRIDAMVDLAVAAFRLFRDRPVALAGQLRDRVVEHITLMRDRAIAPITWLRDTARDRFTDLRDWLTERVQTLRDNTVGRVLDMKDTAVRYFTELRDTADSRIGDLLRWITDKANDIRDAVLKPFRDARDAIGGIVRGVGNAAIDQFNNVLDRISSFVNTFGSAINWVADQLGLGELVGTFSLNHIPRLHSGTSNWGGGPAILHNEEMAVLPPGSRVFNAAQTRALEQGIDGPGDYMGKIPIGIGPFGLGVIDRATDVVGDAWDSISDFGRDLIERPLSWALNQVLDRFDLSLALPGALAGLASEIGSMLRDGLMDLIGGLRDRVKAEQPADDPDAPAPVGGWVRPAHGGVTQWFGQNLVPGFYGPAGHTGVDIANMRGSGIFAANAGTVAGVNMPFSPNTGAGYGNWIRLSHGGGVSTLYAHLLSASVREGQSVEAGQRIASMDNTGASTGDHLHFEVLVNGVAVDPTQYVAFARGGVVDRPTLGLIGEGGQTEIVSPVNLMASTIRDVFNEFLAAGGRREPVTIQDTHVHQFIIEPNVFTEFVREEVREVVRDEIRQAL